MNVPGTCQPPVQELLLSAGSWGEAPEWNLGLGSPEEASWCMPAWTPWGYLGEG